MSIKAVFLTGQTEITVNGLHQWDYGQQLEIHADDFQGIVEVHFACLGMTEAVVRPCDMVGGAGAVTIPDACLEQSAPIKAWVYEKNGDAGTTTKTITLKVTPRARPTSSEAPPPEVIDQYTEAVTAMNEAVGKVANGDVIVQKARRSYFSDEADWAEEAAEARKAKKAETAEKDTEGNNLALSYHLGPITTRGEKPKYFVNEDVDIDALHDPSQHCGVYTINWDTTNPEKGYTVTTLPADFPSNGGACRLIVEADYNDSDKNPTVFQTLKVRGSNDTSLLIWTRRYNGDEVGWTKWRRFVSAEELTEGTLLPAKAEQAKADEQGKPLDKKLNLGEFWANDSYNPDAVAGYVRANLVTSTTSNGTEYKRGVIPGGGLIMFYIRTTDQKTNAVVLMDTAQGAEIHSGIFLLKYYTTAEGYDRDGYILKLVTPTPTEPTNPYFVELWNPYIHTATDGGHTFKEGYQESFGDKYEIFYKYLARY